MGGSALPPLPPHAHLENCQFWKVFGNWHVIIIPPNNRHIIAKIIYKILIFHQLFISNFAPKRQLRGGGSGGVPPDMGGKGGTIVPPKK